MPVQNSDAEYHSGGATFDIAEDLQRAFTLFNDALFDGSLKSRFISLSRAHATYSYISNRQYANLDGRETSLEIVMNPAYFMTRPMKETLASLVHEMVHCWEFELRGGLNKRQLVYHSRAWSNRMKGLGLHPSQTGEPFLADGVTRPADYGDTMSQYIIPGGEFDRTADALIAETRSTFRWIYRFPAAEPRGLEIPEDYKPPTEPPDTRLAYEKDAHGVKTFTAWPASILETKLKFQDFPDQQWLDIANRIDWSRSKQQRPTRTKYQCRLCKTQIWGKSGMSVTCVKCNEPYIPTTHSNGYATRPPRNSGIPIRTKPRSR